MRMKIQKSVLREKYSFIVTIVPNSMNCIFRIQGEQKVRDGIISLEEKKIKFEPIELDGYINGINPPKKTINSITLSKEDIFRIREYNP